MTAVAATENDKEFGQVIRDGADVEVLRWNIEIDDPAAAAVISAALNKCSVLAMCTSEWSALYN